MTSTKADNSFEIKGLPYGYYIIDEVTEVKGTNSDDALENNKNCTEEVIFQVKGQRQTKNTFEKKVFFACFFSAQNGEWARKAGSRSCSGSVDGKY